MARSQYPEMEFPEGHKLNMVGIGLATDPWMKYEALIPMSHLVDQEGLQDRIRYHVMEFLQVYQANLDGIGLETCR